MRIDSDMAFSTFLQLIARIDMISDLDFFCNSGSERKERNEERGEALPCTFPCGRILIKTLKEGRDSATAEQQAKIDR